MNIFQCRTCANPIYFENTACETCGAALGYLSGPQVISTLTDAGSHWTALADPGTPYRYCDNHAHDVCNWLLPADAPERLCPACELNGTIPNLEDPGHLLAWRELEAAKHRLVYSIHRFGLPLRNKSEDPETGLAFDFLSEEDLPPENSGVLTGHANGRITIDIAEADPSRRERTRTQMAESYRTLVGHFRHEVGHYYWERLVHADADTLDAFRRRFGDERADYAGALENHYASGPPADWRERFVSAYSSSHPWEDWAETWAHYFHIVDTLDTAHAFRISLTPRLEDVPAFNMRADFDPYLQPDIDAIINACIPLTLAINCLNRSMGQPDLYPFVLPSPAVEKLRFVHRLIRAAAVDDRS